MTKAKLLSGFLLSVLFSIVFTGKTFAQMVGANAYIKGTSVEIGISGAGGFEGVPVATSPPLGGMHQRTNNISGAYYFGFVANPQLNGWAGSAFDGDFFTPGTPENGWGLEVGTAGTTYSNNCNASQQIPGSITSWQHIFNCYTSDWQGDINNIHVKINYFLQETDLYYTTTISFTNNTGATIPDMYYYRNVDPDNNIMVNGTYVTQNTIENQPAGACGIAHVSATQSSPATSYLGFAAIGANWRASYGGFANRDASAIWSGTGFTQTIGSTISADEAISIAYRIQNLAPGATETFKFVTILSASQAGNAVNNLLYLFYPGSAAAPPPVCTPFADTVRICAGAPATISIQGSIVNEFTWSWAPATGLSTTVGPSTSAGPMSTTTYTLTGTPTSACVAPYSATFVVQTTPGVTANPVADITTCAGATVAASAYGSTPGGATFAWTNSNTAIGLGASGSGNTPAFTATNTTGAPITSTITVTPSIPSGCTGPPITYTITVNPGLTIGVNSPTICAGATANLTATGGTSYTWTAGATSTGTATADASPVVTTTYTVTGTTGSCTGTAVSTVTIGGSIAIGVNSPTICPGDVANLTATGGTSYTWSAGATSTGTATADASPAATTTYTVTGNTGGCTGTAVSTVTVNPTPTVTVPANINICNGGTVAASAFASTPAGGTFDWTNSDASIGLAANGIGNTPSFTAINTGSTAVTATITVTPTVNGCVGTPNTYTITIEPTPVAPTAPGTSTCLNTSTTVTATAPGGTYTWYDAPAAGTLLQTGASYTTPNLAAATNYYVQTTSAAGCVSPMTTVPVTIAAGLVVNAGADDSICFAGSTVLGVTPNGAGYTYSWTPGTGLSSTTIFNPIASPATTTDYTVTVTSAAGCVGSDIVRVYANTQISIAKTAFDVTCNGACNGQAIVIPSMGGGGYQYSWTNGDTTASITGLCPGSYTVTVTDAWGCTATADTSVTEPTLLVATLTAQTAASCNGICDATATVSGSGGTPGASGYTYSWNTTPVQGTATATALCAGTYTCTITDANGCTATTTVTITEPTLVVIAPIADDTICDSGSTGLLAIASGGNGAPYAYVWTLATGLSNDTIANPTANPASTTTYTVNATDVNGCPAAAETVTVVVNPPLQVVAAGTASVCPGFGTMITATASFGGGSPYSYSWSPAAGLDDATLASPTATPATTTTYTVTANDGCSPSVSATVTVTVLPLPVPAFSSNLTAGCSPLCVNFWDLTTISSGAISSWTWDFGNPVDSLGDSTSHCFVGAGIYPVTITTVSAAGCVSTLTIPNYITVYPDPNALASAPQSTSIIDPTVPFTDLSSGATQWHWDFNDPMATSGNDTSILQNPTHVFTDVGTYTADLIVTNTHGCSDTTSVTIMIDPEFTFYIPNAFSPNGDNINDEFYGKGDFFIEFEMSIFDRWGNLIFFADDIDEHWDGTANKGKEIAQQDVYVYVVKLTDHKNKKHKYIGSVTLVK